MNLKELLKQKHSELLALKASIEAGDVEAIEKADALTTEISDIEANIAKAEKASSLLAKLGNTEQETVKTDTTAVKSIGEFAAKHLDIASIKGRQGASVSTPAFKAPDTYTHFSLPEVSYSRDIAPLRVATPLRDAFASDVIAGNAYSWVIMTETKINLESGITPEGGKKRELGMQYGRVTRPLQKITGWFKDTDELLEDNGYLARAIENRGVSRIRRNTEEYIAAMLAMIMIQGFVQSDDGDVSIPTAGPSVISAADMESITAPQLADYIYESIANVKATSGVDPDTVVVTSDIAKMLRTGRDGAGQYYGGGYFYGPYGNGGFQMLPDLWGLKVIVDDTMADIEGPASPIAIVGNFALGASVVTKQNGGMRVEATNSNEDDFLHDLVTVRLEERMLFAMREPGMFSAVMVSQG